MNSRAFYKILGEAIYRIDGAYDVFAKNSKVTSNMLWLLCALRDGEQHSQCQICRDWHFPRTTVNTLVKELEEKGFLQLEPIPGCKREMNISLTEAGKAYAAEIVAPVWDAEDALFQQFFGDRDLSFVHELHAFADAMEEFFAEKTENERSMA